MKCTCNCEKKINEEMDGLISVWSKAVKENRLKEFGLEMVVKKLLAAIKKHKCS